MSVFSTLALMPYVSGLTPLVHDKHMERGWKDLILEMPCLKDEIQTRRWNVVISSAHHGPVATNTGHEEGQDKALLQQSREDRIHRVLQGIAPVSHPMVLL
jgi:hypothetical protein